MTSLDLAVIGNSNIAALIDRGGRIVWTAGRASTAIRCSVR